MQVLAETCEFSLPDLQPKPIPLEPFKKIRISYLFNISTSSSDFRPSKRENDSVKLTCNRKWEPLR